MSNEFLYHYMVILMSVINMISDKELITNMTAEEKFAITCRVKEINPLIIQQVLDEIQSKGTYDEGDYDCIGECYHEDPETGCGEIFAYYIIYLEDIYESTYDKLSKECQFIIDLAKECNIKEFRISEDNR